MLDNNHRVINYLRLSVTDRCNLRCIYCMPEKGIRFMTHSEILTYEEMFHIVRLSIQKGIRKVRLTGGEPLVRKGFISFLERLCKIKGLEEITLTTNGMLLKSFAADIKNCGISRINVSLDSLRPERFFRITGRDCFKQVWEGIEEAEHMGFNPIKINVVAIKGVNDDEILDFATLTLEKPYHIRFIELMPIGDKNISMVDKFISSKEIFKKIETISILQPIANNLLDGPAERYALEGAKGEVGFIGALSNHFCDKCNRLRLTPEGHLRGCLFSDQEIDLKTPLRQEKKDAYLLQLIELAIKNKPKEHGLLEYGPRKCIRQMNSIGG
ncbi:MAG: GTP 3',8-cyclase MoaA [Desulfobacteraceae bacterium]|nr:MAG: GTP 3',8-cyclase MoaA [Desulfobacteraceae bacterium]